MGWRVPYIIAKLLERRYLKWAHMTHLDIWNISYGQKKGRESNWQFLSRPLKVRNHCDFLMCRWRATYCWKALDEGYNFASYLISIKGVHGKLWAYKIVGILVVEIWGLPLGNPGTKCHLMWALWRGTKYTIKGKVVASPKSELWWVLWVRVCPWLILAPKVLQLCTNQLVVWFCADSCEWLMLVILPSPIPELQHAPLPLQSASN
jgi:hypothetical protein